MESIPSILRHSLNSQSLETSEAKGKLHLVVIGINEYKNADLDLNFGVPDGQSISQYMTRSNSLFSEIKIYSLFNSNADTDSIRSIMKRLENISLQDTVLIYMAGHGDSIDDSWYFVPYELEDPYEPESLQAGGVSSHMLMQWIADIKAQQIMLLIDACKSGAAVTTFEQFKDSRSMLMLARSSGIHIATASTREQFAMELGLLGHGLFTYTVMEALSGRADTSPRDGLVTTDEIMNFIRDEMPELISKYQLDRQTPVLNSQGNSFSIIRR